MKVPHDTGDTPAQPTDLASRWLGRRLAWEHRLTELRADAARTPGLTRRVRPPVPSRRVA